MESAFQGYKPDLWSFQFLKGNDVMLEVADFTEGWLYLEESEVKDLLAQGVDGTNLEEIDSVSAEVRQSDVEVVSWRLIASGPSASRDSAPRLGSAPAKARSTRKAHFDGADIDTPVYDRSELARGQSFAGPAIIEERETTIIILPGWTAKVDASGCIMAAKG